MQASFFPSPVDQHICGSKKPCSVPDCGEFTFDVHSARYLLPSETKDCPRERHSKVSRVENWHPDFGTDPPIFIHHIFFPQHPTSSSHTTMPFSRPMQNAVLQAVFLQVCQLIISHHLQVSTENLVTNNDLFYQISNATEFINNATAAVKTNETSLPIAVNATSLGNFTAINGTTTTSGSSKIKKSFYGHELPRDVLTVMIVTILEYYWQTWLERILPARPRPANFVPEKISPEDDDQREEEVVKKWIAQGKIRRASLSFWNTAIKWLLDITAGQFAITCVFYLMENLLSKGDVDSFTNSLKWVSSINCLRRPQPSEIDEADVDH